jgi:hypothetical protein
VNVKAGKIQGLKSHDYHIIMKRLLPVMLCGYLNDNIWEALAELSYYYGQLCAKEIKKDRMEKLDKEIPVLICKLEKYFLQGGSIQCNIILFIFYMKLTLAALCSICGCNTLKGTEIS